MSCCGFIGKTLQATANNIARFLNSPHEDSSSDIADIIKRHTHSTPCYFSMFYGGILFNTQLTDIKGDIAAWLALLDAEMMTRKRLISICADYDTINERYYFEASFQ